ncbi:MAG: hypothetical protein K1X78_19375 [Verrucomicrobiaceae bacterium]|nr:hypothetical protein [Verrucomicrobiaceae bacterium]
MNENQKRIQNLTPWEIWGFIAGRVFMSFGLGVLVMQHFPQVASSLAFPSVFLGFICLVFAAKGLWPKEAPKA